MIDQGLLDIGPVLEQDLTTAAPQSSIATCHHSVSVSVDRVVLLFRNIQQFLKEPLLGEHPRRFFYFVNLMAEHDEHGCSEVLAVVFLAVITPLCGTLNEYLGWEYKLASDDYLVLPS